jgi:hypothetical protein
MPKTVYAVLALLSLSLCLVSAVLHFLGHLPNETYKVVFLAASAGWFVLATLWAWKRKRA